MSGMPIGKARDRYWQQRLVGAARGGAVMGRRGRSKIPAGDQARGLRPSAVIEIMVLCDIETSAASLLVSEKALRAENRGGVAINHLKQRAEPAALHVLARRHRRAAMAMSSLDGARAYSGVVTERHNHEKACR